MKKLIILLLLVPVFAFAQTAKYSPDGVPYYESYLGPSYPTLIYLHGNGQSGDGTINTLTKIKQVAFYTKLYQSNKTRFNIFMPQYKSSSNGWGDLGIRFVDFILENYTYDGRYYLTGHSSGGKGSMHVTSYMFANNKKLPTGVAVVAGEADYKATLPLAGKVKVKLLVGDRDNTITTQDKKTIFEKMTSIRNWLYGDKYEGDLWRKYPGVGHGSDTYAYDTNEGLAAWFLSLGVPKEPAPPTPPVKRDSLISLYMVGDSLYYHFQSGTTLIIAKP